MVILILNLRAHEGTLPGTWYEIQNDQNNRETMKKWHLGERSIIIGNYYVTSCLLSQMKQEFFLKEHAEVTKFYDRKLFLSPKNDEENNFFL